MTLSNMQRQKRHRVTTTTAAPAKRDVTIQRYTADDKYNMLPDEHKPQYNTLRSQLSTKQHTITYYDLGNTASQHHNTAKQFHQLLCVHTHTRSVDTFKPLNADAKQTCPLLQLSTDLMFNVLRYLTFTELLDAREVCIALRQTVYNSQLWQSDATTHYQHFMWRIRLAPQPITSIDLRGRIDISKWCRTKSQRYANDWLMQQRLQHVTTVKQLWGWQSGRCNDHLVHSIAQTMPNIQHVQTRDHGKLLTVFQAMPNLRSVEATICITNNTYCDAELESMCAYKFIRRFDVRLEIIEPVEPLQLQILIDTTLLVHDNVHILSFDVDDTADQCQYAGIVWKRTL